jgi:hypothetical protein
VDRELIVTVVFDCCHSAGATRGIDAAERGVEFIDKTPRPTESDVATIDKLRAAWIKAVGGDGTRSLATAATPPGYTLLAACRPSEKANEFAFDGKVRNGALTYWLLDALRQGGTEQTFKMVYDRVLAKIYSQFPSQTPMLIGDPGRFVFDGRQSRPAFATLVKGVEADGRRVTLAAGLASGITDGAEFVIYPRTVVDISRPEGRTARVRVAEVRDAESSADVIERFGAEVPDSGDQAVLLAAPVALRRRVKFVDRKGKPAPVDDPDLLPVRQALPGNGWVEAVEGPDEAGDFAIRLTEDKGHYEVCKPDGSVIMLRPELPVGGDSPTKLVRRLVHLAKYRAWSELENKAPNASLQKRLKVELLAFPEGFDPKRLPWPEPQAFADPVPEVPIGRWVALRITNNSPRTVNVSVLDLQPDWGISLAYPSAGGFEELDPVSDGGMPLVIPLRADLPKDKDYEQGLDTVKVIASFHPLGFQAAELPPLDNPLPQPKGTRSASGDPLEQLLAAIESPGARTRAVAAFSLPGREWAAAQVAVQVRRGSSSPDASQA